MTDTMPRKIFHYTSSNGLLGILKKDKIVFWFSDIKCLNDKSEGQMFGQVFRGLCDEYLHAGRINEAEHDVLMKFDFSPKGIFTYTVLDKNNDKVEELTKLKQFMRSYYLCSFCEDGDLLDMWRYYSKDTVGYSVGIKGGVAQSRTEGKSPFDVNNDALGRFIWRHVIYDYDEQRKLVAGKLDEFLKFMKEYNQSFNESALSALNWFVQDLRFTFKAPCFSNEREVRCILEVPDGEVKDKKNYEIKYRTQAGVLVPYVEVEFEKSLVTDITIGPLAPEHAILSTRKFADSIKNSIKVTQSTLPIRF